jgi:hypothetical protein
MIIMKNLKSTVRVLVIVISSFAGYLFFLYLLSFFIKPGLYVNSKNYSFKTTDSVLVSTLKRMQMKYPNIFSDTSKYFYNDFTFPRQRQYYSRLCVKSVKMNIYYCFVFKKSSLHFFQIIDKNGNRYRLNDELNDEESEKYIQDFETSILPLLEKELGINAEFED